MASTENDLITKTDNLKLKEDRYINILLLGETGVGKSTFVNAITNYLTYSDFKRATKENLLMLIPSKCKVKDKNNEFHIIQIGSEEDQNECLDTGMSATQDVKSYVFPIWNGSIKVRFIDTPGMCDVRGIDQDNVNSENILSFIGQMHELDAICILFKPTNSRITALFDYCFTQILSRLDKSASRNLIFVFTNTRGTDYGPGDTYPSLQKVIDDIKAKPPHVEIPFNKKNIFCFDNEAYKYLAAVKQNIQFEDSVKQRNCDSWKRSVEECNRLIKYIVGDANNPPLKPHHVKSTSAINEARRLIVQLSQPLAEISQLINDNLYSLQRHEENLKMDTNNLEELRQKLYIPVVDLETKTLTQPVTVCAHRKCATMYKVEGRTKWHYTQRCHDPCYLKNVPSEIIGTPELVSCASMNPSTKKCRQCLCDFSVHMHVYYQTETVTRKIIDDNVKQNLDTKEIVLARAKRLIDRIYARKDELEKEHKIIVKTCAKFAHFLQNNAITAFNDSYKQYINYLISREESLGIDSNMSVIHHLKNLLQEYDMMKRAFDEALSLQKQVGESDVFITPQNIQESIQELYQLKHNGTKIKELYECQKKSRSKEHRKSEYIHQIPKQLQNNVVSKIKIEKQPKGVAQSKKLNYKNHGGNQQNQRGRQPFRSQRDASQHRGRERTPPPVYQESPPPRFPPQNRQYQCQDRNTQHQSNRSRYDPPRDFYGEYASPQPHDYPCYSGNYPPPPPPTQPLRSDYYSERYDRRSDRDIRPPYEGSGPNYNYAVPSPLMTLPLSVPIQLLPQPYPQDRRPHHDFYRQEDYGARRNSSPFDTPHQTGFSGLGQFSQPGNRPQYDPGNNQYRSQNFQQGGNRRANLSSRDGNANRAQFRIRNANSQQFKAYMNKNKKHRGQTESEADSD